MEGQSFRLCALDEASQAVEPPALMPLLHGCEATLMIGDANYSREANKAYRGVKLGCQDAFRPLPDGTHQLAVG